MLKEVHPRITHVKFAKFRLFVKEKKISFYIMQCKLVSPMARPCYILLKSGAKLTTEQKCGSNSNTFCFIISLKNTVNSFYCIDTI